MKTAGSMETGNGTLSRANETRLWYQTVTGASPYPAILTWPRSSTFATLISPLENFAQRVTSFTLPSE